MKPEEIKTIGILGTGTVGWSWATFFAAKGMSVRMFDADKCIQENGVRKAKESLEALVEYGALDKSQLDSALGNISTVNDLAQMAEGADYIQESVYESYEVKKTVFHELDSLASPKTILASSTSGLLISKIQEAAKIPGRCLVVHPFNPPHLVPLVELVPGPQTDLQLVEDVKCFFEGLGKIPVILKKEAPGHIANRLAAALWRESVNIVAKGIASVEDVDKALYAGPGIRWALMGQHMIYHLGGGEGGYRYLIDHLGTIASAQWKDLASWTEIPEESKDMLVEGVNKSMGDRTLAEVARWRDRKIVELIKVIYDKPLK
ncbi:MAG: 3-hydroxyacyl-CoA dehydrogenase family protein [Desulfomonile tiedjei]|nr:3-hydroxyacyl-CoA dehydrogenase family protein [Desulfomonile tiedjei]